MKLFYYFSLGAVIANLTALLSLLARVFNNFKPAYFSLIGISLLVSGLTLIIVISASQKGVKIPLPVFFTSSVLLISVILGGVLAWWQ